MEREVGGNWQHGGLEEEKELNGGGERREGEREAAGKLGQPGGGRNKHGETGKKVGAKEWKGRGWVLP